VGAEVLPPSGEKGVIDIAYAIVVAQVRIKTLTHFEPVIDKVKRVRQGNFVSDHVILSNTKIDPADVFAPAPPDRLYLSSFNCKHNIFCVIFRNRNYFS
jgi:hypothetical protein